MPAVSALVLAVALAQPLGLCAMAYQSTAPADSTKTDSVPRRNNAEGLMLPFMAAFAGVLALAPPMLLLRAPAIVMPARVFPKAAEPAASVPI